MKGRWKGIWVPWKSRSRKQTFPSWLHLKHSPEESQSWDWDNGSSVTCLPHHEDLSSDPKHPREIWHSGACL